MKALNNPSRIWEPIYENLGEVERAVLLSLLTLPRETLLSDLEQATHSLLQQETVDTVRFEQALGTAQLSIDSAGLVLTPHLRRCR